MVFFYMLGRSTTEHINQIKTEIQLIPMYDESVRRNGQEVLRVTRQGIPQCPLWQAKETLRMRDPDYTYKRREAKSSPPQAQEKNK
jgi:hypothetical protein